jgi:acyl carrier protein phosphodiesterase
MAPHMIADDWLGSYSDLSNVGRALDGIAQRITRSNPLAGALTEIETNYAALDDDFRRFFPELQTQARQILSTLVRLQESD